jgi:thiol-disulfide isomerase/thioredoxin
MNRQKLLIQFMGIGLLWANSLKAQGRLEIHLRINETHQQKIGEFIDFSNNSGPKEQDYILSLAADSDSGMARASGGVLINARRLKTPRHAYQLKIDTNGDGSFADETAQIISPGSSITVSVNRERQNGSRQKLPYTLKCFREKNRRGDREERFSWSPHYRAEGTLKVKNCETLFVVLDLDGDGSFDRSDFARGTNIGIDRNGDGRIWGEGEWLKGEQIIEYCEDYFLVDSLREDGTLIALVPTLLRVPKIGESLPKFSLATLEGKIINAQDLRGRTHLIDFWASWCKPCVEKFAAVKQLEAEYQGKLSIIAVNVDQESRVEKAKQAIKDYELSWPHAMSGKGEADPLWKMFGGMEGNRLSIPLYVLVDAEGVLRYAGDGGKELSELRDHARLLLNKR